MNANLLAEFTPTDSFCIRTPRNRVAISGTQSRKSFGFLGESESKRWGSMRSNNLRRALHSVSYELIENDKAQREDRYSSKR